MAAQDHNGERRSPRGVPTGVDHSLDTLARGLADGTLSRRKALRLMGAALVGTALAAIPGLALAKPKPGKCNKDKHCPSGQQCVNGTCQGGCPDSRICGDSCCTAEESCYRTITEPICCSDDPQCEGAASAAGPPVCYMVLGPGELCNRPTCNTDADCSGEVCIQLPGCPDPGNRCVPAC
jgi:hypothetical protein